jgi:hypothetical protein
MSYGVTESVTVCWHRAVASRFSMKDDWLGAMQFRGTHADENHPDDTSLANRI